MVRGAKEGYNGMNPQILLLPEVNWTTHTKQKTCGVYMLMQGDVIQYIGQSKDVDTRIAAHRTVGDFPFDSVKVSVLPASELNDTERALIEKHQPPFNSIHTPRQRVRNGSEKKMRSTVYITTRSRGMWRDLAKMERRSLNSWLQQTIEQAWNEKCKPEATKT